MSGKKVAVFGIYSTLRDVERAKDELARAGFPAADVSVLLSKSVAWASDMGMEANTKAPEGYASRLKKGGILLSVQCDTPGEIARAKEVVEGRAPVQEI